MTSALLFAGMLLLLGLASGLDHGCAGAFEGGQIIVEAIEGTLPVLAIALDPVRDLFKRSRIETAWAPLSFTAAPDEAGAFEDLEVLGDGGRANGKRLSEFFDRGFAERETGQNGATGGIGKGGEGGAEMVRHFNSPIG
jgi:hypothetical protein